MLIGQKNSFAIQYELDDDHGKEWLFGKVCYWINGAQIGSYDLGTSLRDVLFQMKYIISDCGNRKGESLCFLNHGDIFLFLDRSIYGNCDEYVGNLTVDTPHRYDIRIPVDVFDNWKLYLLDCVSNAILLYKHNDCSEVRVSYIELMLFDSVIKKFYTELSQLYEKFA